MTFSLILEHWQTRKLMFITLEDCVDMDDAINHVHNNQPDFEIMQITHQS